jgi:drug/metabolite transporter (DMT)-like permease
LRLERGTPYRWADADSQDMGATVKLSLAVRRSHGPAPLRESPVIGGILLGLGAALSQSLSYLCSKAFIRSAHRTTVDLLSLGHILMGGFAVAILPFVWPERMPGFGDYALPLAGASLFYLAGQAFLFVALHRTDASRVSPLLGMKVFFLALLSLALFGEQLAWQQWVAVGMSVVAAWLLGATGGGMSLASALWVLLACLSYCGSDLSIARLVVPFGHLAFGYRIVLAVSLCYIVCGVAGGVMLCFLRRPTAGTWLRAVPFAVTWYGAMLFLFGCFASIGVVYGNIVQSTRGLMSIGLGAAMAAAGFVRLERHVSRDVLFRRLGAALLMTGAIALFYQGR